jgi:epoxyqueuosine reductase
VTSAQPSSGPRLEQAIKDEACRLGFVLAGFTTPAPPPHWSDFEEWLKQGRHASMKYLANDRSRARRRDPLSIMPKCRTILVLAIPYSDPSSVARDAAQNQGHGRIAAYGWGADYHAVIPKRLQAIVTFIQDQVGHAVSSRWYTDTGPVLERDLAQRAGLGWIGKNTCLINPRAGSYLLLSEILLDMELRPDAPFETDRCGKCTRCIKACPMGCILPDRTIDAGRCISYLTIELKDAIPAELRPQIGNWIFGCDLCQMICPWNRFAAAEGDAAFRARAGLPQPDLIHELELTPDEFAIQFRGSPVKRARQSGHRRNAAVALGNEGRGDALPVLERALHDPDPLVREHAGWAITRINERNARDE